ncbi:phage tail protein [Vibrio cholerae]|nr:phage tail protein [Vibrio cholerae]
MASVMLSLGGFKFHIDAASYNQLVRTWQWRWQSQTRIGQADSLHYTGKAPVKISLSGHISTTRAEVGTHQIEKLAAMGDERKPHLLVSGEGDVLGYWCMTDLNETNTKFVRGGLPRYQTFTLELVFYGDDL